MPDVRVLCVFYRYMMKLQPFIEGNFTINGYTEITFDVQETTRNVTLHINDISTLNDTIKVSNRCIYMCNILS